MARLNMVMAVLEARADLAFSGHDIYLNVAGGLRIQEPAADLAVAAALISALTGQPVPADAVVFGEVGLSGEVRAVAQRDLRLKEAAKLGFKRGWVPRPARRDKKSDDGKSAESKSALALEDMGHVQDVVSQFSAALNEPPNRQQSGVR
jgi:DNA repair protein RadA/Sms